MMQETIAVIKMAMAMVMMMVGGGDNSDDRWPQALC